jgi:hypothetical protein
MNLKSKFFNAQEIAPGTTTISGLAMARHIKTIKEAMAAPIN